MKTADRHTHRPHSGSNEHGHRSGDHSFSHEVGALGESLSQLKTDASEVLSSAASAGQSAVTVVRETAADAVDAVKDQLSDISGKATKSARSLQKQIAVHPIASAAIGVGVGWLVARFLLGRASKAAK